MNHKKNKMKKYLPLLLVLILSVACKKEQKTTTTTTTTTAPPAKTSDVTTNSDGTVHVKSNHSAFLVGMWQYGFFIGPDSEKEKYKGRWIKFNRDDTFVSGQYEEETNKGTYVCLLYTSPSPRDRQKSRMPSSA